MLPPPCGGLRRGPPRGQPEGGHCTTVAPQVHVRLKSISYTQAFKFFRMPYNLLKELDKILRTSGLETSRNNPGPASAAPGSAKSTQLEN
jgi:hypothetical protein